MSPGPHSWGLLFPWDTLICHLLSETFPGPVSPSGPHNIVTVPPLCGSCVNLFTHATDIQGSAFHMPSRALALRIWQGLGHKAQITDGQKFLEENKTN